MTDPIAGLAPSSLGARNGVEVLRATFGDKAPARAASFCVGAAAAGTRLTAMVGDCGTLLGVLSRDTIAGFSFEVGRVGVVNSTTGTRALTGGDSGGASGFGSVALGNGWAKAIGLLPPNCGKRSAAAESAAASCVPVWLAMGGAAGCGNGSRPALGEDCVNATGLLSGSSVGRGDASSSRGATT